MSASISRLPLVLSLLAIVLGGGLIAQAFMFQNTINSLNDKLNNVNGKVNTLQAPKIQNLTVSLIMAGTTNSSATPEGLSYVEYHRWDPSVLVVHLGDTVNLTVRNTDDSIHSLKIDAFQTLSANAVDTGNIAGYIGTGPYPTAKVTFVANKAGVFAFYCNVPYNPNTNDCVPDHANIVGYLVVIA